MTGSNNIGRRISITLLLVGLSFTALWLASPPVYSQVHSLVGKGLGTILTPNGKTILVEIADSPDKRMKGLMFRPSMAPDRGMLFQFPENGDHTFWMKNTLISLDIFWLDESGNILHIETNVPICTRKDDSCPRVRAGSQSIQVLELNAGMAKKFELAVGKQLKIDLPPMSFPY